MRRVQRDDERSQLPAARPSAEALAELEACAKSHFDPRVVAALGKVIGTEPALSPDTRRLQPLVAVGA